MCKCYPSRCNNALPTHFFSFFSGSFKSGKVVIVLAGRYAGRKAVVVRASDEGSTSKKFGQAIGA